MVNMFDNISYVLVYLLALLPELQVPLVNYQCFTLFILLTTIIPWVPVCCRWANLKDALIDNRSKLGEAQTLQQFSRDADEMENWLQEKLQIASDESYKDPANIQVHIVLGASYCSCSWGFTSIHFRISKIFESFIS